MSLSHVIEIDGAFVGAAIRPGGRCRFIATEIRMDELDGTTWRSPADARRLAHRLLRNGGFAAASEPCPPVAR